MAVDFLVKWPRETVDSQCVEIVILEAAFRRLDLPLQAGGGSTLDNGNWADIVNWADTPSELTLATP